MLIPRFVNQLPLRVFDLGQGLRIFSLGNRRYFAAAETTNRLARLSRIGSACLGDNQHNFRGDYRKVSLALRGYLHLRPPLRPIAIG